MASPLSPSTMTDGQIDKIADNVRAALRKIRRNFSSVNIQQALESGRLDAEILPAVKDVLERVIAEVTDIVIRTVTVNYDLTPHQLLNLTNRRQHTDQSVVATMPHTGTGTEQVQVEFFKLNNSPIRNNDLEKEYQHRGLTPDPYAQAQVNIDDPNFANNYPNSTHWKDASGNWCIVNFNNCGDRLVGVYSSVWADYFWFGGVRKK